MSELASLPRSVCIVHMNLAREAAHPEGSAADSYSAILPLHADGRLDEQSWRGPGGAWLLDFGDAGEPERGFRFGSEHFRTGEYVSVVREGEEHTYRIVSLRPVKG